MLFLAQPLKSVFCLVCQTTYRVFLFFIFGAILWDAGCRVNERVIIAYEGIFAIILETLEIQGEL
jgi:hypothetical protein